MCWVEGWAFHKILLDEISCCLFTDLGDDLLSGLGLRGDLNGALHGTNEGPGVTENSICDGCKE